MRMSAVMGGVLLAVLGCGLLSARAAEKPTFTLGFSFAVTGYAENQRFVRPGGLCYDAKRDEVLVADSGNGQIVVISGNGVPVTRIRHTVTDSATGELRKGEPKSVAVRANGDLLVTDNLCGYLDILNFQGRAVEKLWPGTLLDLPKTAVQPRCLAVDAADNVYVSVVGKLNAILVLGPDLTLKAVIGKIPDSNSALATVTGLWVDRDGRIYATYSQGDCVRIYDAEGRVLHSFGAHDSGPQNFSLPSGVVTDQRGHLWVVDTLRHTVATFRAAAGATPAFAGGIGGFGQRAGQFGYPVAIAGDGVSKLFVLESTGARLQAFTVTYPGGA